MPNARTRSSNFGIGLALSRREYSLWVWRWTNAIRLGEDIGALAHCQKRAAPDIFSRDALGREPARTGPDDGSVSSRDRGRSARGTGHVGARLPPARGVSRRQFRRSRPPARPHGLPPGLLLT